MNSTTKKVLVVGVLIFGFAGFFQSCIRELKDDFEPKPISSDNMPHLFLVLGIDQGGSEQLVILADYSQAFRSGDVEENSYAGMPVLRTGENRFRFLIEREQDAESLPTVERTMSLNNKKLSTRVIQDHGVMGRQLVYLTWHNDDSTYKYVYEAREKEAIPLAFGSLTKRQGVRATALGLRVFCVRVLGAVMFLLLLLWCERRGADESGG